MSEAVVEGRAVAVGRAASGREAFLAAARRRGGAGQPAVQRREAEHGLARLVEKAPRFLVAAHRDLRGERHGQPHEEQGEDQHHHHHLEEREGGRARLPGGHGRP